MASWQSSWWLLIWTVFMHSALLQVISQEEEGHTPLCLLRSIILDHLRCGMTCINPMPRASGFLSYLQQTVFLVILAIRMIQIPWVLSES